MLTCISLIQFACNLDEFEIVRFCGLSTKASQGYLRDVLILNGVYYRVHRRRTWQATRIMLLKRPSLTEQGAKELVVWQIPHKILLMYGRSCLSVPCGEMKRSNQTLTSPRRGRKNP